MDETEDIGELLERFAREVDADLEGSDPIGSVDLRAAADEIHHLKVALASRSEIGQAQGRIMEQLGLDADRAFALLVRLSQHTNRKLVDVSREVVATGVLPKDPLTDD